MIRHIVMWKFRPGTEAEARNFMEKLSALYGVIPQIRAQQIGVDCSASGKNYSAVLVSDFDSLEDLETYKNDPATRRCPPCARRSGRTGWRWTTNCKGRRTQKEGIYRGISPLYGEKRR